MLVNNAGWDDLKPFLDTDEAFWDRIIDINFKGPLRFTRALLPGMVERRWGRIINIGSDAGRVGSSLESVYSGAKGGLIAFTKTIAREHARHGITANVVCPGPTDTPFMRETMDAQADADAVLGAMVKSVPMRRLAEPEEIATAVRFFAARRSGLRDRPDALRERRPDDGMSILETDQLTDVAYEVDNGLATITINRPERLNSFRARTLDELIECLKHAWTSADVGVVCLTGAGEKAFCTGGDQKQRMETGDYGPSKTGRLEIDTLHRTIRDIPKPVIAAVNGYAIGGGHVLHVLCDLTIAADTAVFGQVGPKVGSFDAGFGTGYLARVIGEKRAREIWFLCKQYGPEQALEWGLINKIVPQRRALRRGPQLGRPDAAAQRRRR